ncbi:MAG: TadE/TadG family type IV pilus assembly protein [Gemmatimonadota bacterium]
MAPGGPSTAGAGRRAAGRRRLGGTGGQSLVEFALVAPILLLLVIGIAEFGRAWMAHNVVTGAAREAVRIAAVNASSTSTDNTWMARAEAIMSSAALTGPAPQISEAGDAISVTVTCDFTPVVAGFIPGLDGPIQLSSTSTMRKEY